MHKMCIARPDSKKKHGKERKEKTKVERRKDKDRGIKKDPSKN